MKAEGEKFMNVSGKLCPWRPDFLRRTVLMAPGRSTPHRAAYARRGAPLRMT